MELVRINSFNLNMNDLPNSTKFTEGSTELVVPSNSISDPIPPKSPAFFNPLAKNSRDLSIIICKLESTLDRDGLTVGDVFAGVGARGIRIANEVKGINSVLFNDLNSTAIKYAKVSSKLNDLYSKCEFSEYEASKFLIDRSSSMNRLSIVDIDPFGSPSPYIENALRSVKRNGILSITATDTPVLCGVYPNVSFRQYGGYSLRSEYCHELGLRLLIGATVSSCMKLSLGIKPLFCQVDRHYMRVYMRLLYGLKYSEACRLSLGFIEHCIICNSRYCNNSPIKFCKTCNSKTKIAGPLWIKPIFDEPYLDQALNLDNLPESYSNLFSLAKSESNLPPTYYISDVISDLMDVPSVSPNSLVDELKNQGFPSSRTTLNPKGIRSEASIDQIKEAILSFNR